MVQRAVMILFVVFLASTAKATDAPRPNVLFIIADDLRDELGCYNAPHIHSPNIDALAKRGMLFERAYCQYALCGPSRASLLTGRYPDRVGVANNATRIRDVHPEIVTLPQHFKNQGYRTRGIGKLLHNGHHDPPSWSDGDHFETKAIYASEQFKDADVGIDGIHASNASKPLFEGPDVADNAYRDGMNTDVAVRALAAFARDGRPFFLMVGYHKPHSPFNAPQKYWDLYQRSKIPLATNQFPPRGTAPFAARGAKYLCSFRGIPNEGRFADALQREIKHAYYACISYVDAQVGRLLTALNQQGLADNTIVIFTSDHGYQLGEHDLWCKHTNFETSTKVPLIIADPRQQQMGSRAATPCELIDLTPTLTELCGIAAHPTADGRSLARILDDPSADQDRTAAALSRYNKGAARGFSLRTRVFRYTEWRHARSSALLASELYDHQRDPAENRNQVKNPDYADVIAELQQRLAKLRQRATP